MAKVLLTGGCGQRRCKHCKELFVADVRNRRHQKYCNAPECRKASKKAAQKRWLGSPKGQGYFRGAENVARVRQWREAHPGYGKRGKTEGALQDLCTSQPALLIGLIASLTGSLQDDIVETTRRFICCGQDILEKVR